MKTLLVVEVSPRFEFSVSGNLTARFVEQWKRGNPHGVVVVRDLFKSHIPFVDLHWIGGAFTPREQRSPESAAAILRFSGLRSLAGWRVDEFGSDVGLTGSPRQSFQ